MTEKQKLIREIETLRESIRTDWQDLATKPLQPNDRKEIRQHIDSCIADLKIVLEQLVDSN